MRRFLSRVSSVAILFCLAAQGNVIAMENEEGPRPAAVASASPRSPQANYEYESSKKALLDLRDTQFPALLKMAQNSKDRFLKGELTSKLVFKIFELCLNKVSLPFRLSIPTEAIFLSMFEKSQERQSLVPQGLSVENLMDLGKDVCDTRVKLLMLKKEVVASTGEQEDLCREAMVVHAGYLSYIGLFEPYISHLQSRLIFVEHNISAIQEIRKLLGNLSELYVHQNNIDALMEILKDQGSYISLEMEMESACEKMMYDMLKQCFNTTMSFIQTGQFEQALNHMKSLDHIKSFKELYEKNPHQKLQQKKISSLIKYLQGNPEDFLGQHLQGNPEDFLGQHLQGDPETALQRDAREKEKRSEEKNKQRRHLGATVKAAVMYEAAQKQREKESASSSQRRRNPEASEKRPQVFELTPHFGQEVISPYDEKEQKRQRHLESIEKKQQEQREREREQERLKEGSPVEGAYAVEEEMAIEQPEEGWGTFKLSTAQRNVDGEIESGSWQFTRQNLRDYYEGFGCKVRQEGSHVTASLPKHQIIDLPDGTPLVIEFNLDDMKIEGGSFTFGDWKGKNVPFYLRPQIREARRKLQVYNRAALREVMQAISKSSDSEEEEESSS